jgi:hypothetical protein
MTLSVVFIFSVVALHGMFKRPQILRTLDLMHYSHRQGHAPILRIDCQFRLPFLFLDTIDSVGAMQQRLPYSDLAFHHPYPLPLVLETGPGLRETGKVLI